MPSMTSAPTTAGEGAGLSGLYGVMHEAAKLLEELACGDGKKRGAEDVFRAGEVASALMWWRTQLEKGGDAWPPQVEEDPGIPVCLLVRAGEWLEYLALDSPDASDVIHSDKVVGSLRVRLGISGQAAEADGPSAEGEGTPDSGGSSAGPADQERLAAPEA